MVDLTLGLHNCSGCGVPPGCDHEDGCDHAMCPECGQQRLMHDEHESSRPSRWHGIDPAAQVCRQLGWWTTAAGIDHLVEDYTRVLFAEGRGVTWDPDAQRYRIGQVDESAIDAAIRRNGGPW
jgi:hypothetical protein